MHKTSRIQTKNKKNAVKIYNMKLAEYGKIKVKIVCNVKCS